MLIDSEGIVSRIHARHNNSAFMKSMNTLGRIFTAGKSEGYLLLRTINPNIDIMSINTLADIQQQQVQEIATISIQR